MCDRTNSMYLLFCNAIIYLQAIKRYHHFIHKQMQQNQIIHEHGQLHLLYKFQRPENDMVICLNVQPFTIHMHPVNMQLLLKQNQMLNVSVHHFHLISLSSGSFISRKKKKQTFSNYFMQIYQQSVYLVHHKQIQKKVKILQY